MKHTIDANRTHDTIRVPQNIIWVKLDTFTYIFVRESGVLLFYFGLHIAAKDISNLFFLPFQILRIVL